MSWALFFVPIYFGGIVIYIIKNKEGILLDIILVIFLFMPLLAGLWRFPFRLLRLVNLLIEVF